jgi:flagellar export protein FliJ
VHAARRDPCLPETGGGTVKRFRFRLGGVLMLRQRLAERASRAHLDALADAEAADARLEQAQGDVAQLLAQVQDQIARATGAAEAVAALGLLREAQSRLARLQQEAASRWRAVEAASAERQVRHREKKVVEKLRDRAWARHRADEERSEAHEVDEIARQRHLRGTP